MTNSVKPRLVFACIALSVLLGAASACPAQDAPEIRPGHPRIFFDKAGLAQVARHCDKGGLFESSYRNLIADLRNRQMNPRSAYYRSAGYRVMDIAFVYLVETELGRDGNKYLDFIRNGVWKGKPGDRRFKHLFGRSAVAYDWLYNALTVEERDACVEALGPMLRHYSGKPEITLSGGPWWYNQTWGANMTTSWSRDSITAKTMIALAILGEHSRYENDAERWLASLAGKTGECIAKFDALGGVWPEGAGHGSMTYSPFFTWEALRFATGKDLFSKVASPTNFMREVPLWYTYARVPHSGSMAHTDDTGASEFRGPGPAFSINALHARHFRDGLTQHNVRRSIENGGAGWTDMIWYDPTVKPIDPRALPLAYHFKGAGHVYMRSSWDSDATWAFFSAGPSFTAYGLDGEDGSFQITKQGTLAGVAGYSKYGGDEAINRNIMLVYDPNEKPYGRGGGQRRNDGGSKWMPGWHCSEPGKRGVITAFEHNEHYTYAAADVTGAYASVQDSEEVAKKLGSRKIRKYTRQFVYVRGPREFFVVYDRVAAADAAFPKTWLLHVLNEPQVNGTSQAKGEGLETFADADSAFAETASRDEMFRDRQRRSVLDRRWKTRKRGAMAIRSLLPKNPRITKRGGIGFEMWGNPHDPRAGNAKDPYMKYNADKTPKLASWNSMDVCLWRLEIESTERQEEQQFLNVLIPYGDVAGKKQAELSPPASAFKLVQDQDTDAALLDLDGAVWKIAFKKAGPTGGSCSIRQPGGMFKSDLATEVRPNIVPPQLAVSPRP
ncbi:MAG: hypothetical protein AMS16_02300 [Planctomycetes bacterium DG_58]|nr:MAG: hypothetical protein AMS16_02300 [Planctomycetes bacterium DG_58]